MVSVTLCAPPHIEHLFIHLYLGNTTSYGTSGELIFAGDNLITIRKYDLNCDRAVLLCLYWFQDENHGFIVNLIEGRRKI